MTSSPLIRTIATQTHGRYLVRPPDAPPPWPVLVGFHGYGENAEQHLSALETIPGADHWLLVAVQGLHAYYTRDHRIVSSWMTRQDRELAIADNIRYVGRVMDAVRLEYPTGPGLILTGFSQGGAMAYRAAARYGADGLIVLAADVPPDVANGSAGPLPPTLIGRGTADTLYSSDQFNADKATLLRLGVEVDECLFDGGHQWTADFSKAVAERLRSTRPRRTDT